MHPAVTRQLHCPSVKSTTSNISMSCVDITLPCFACWCCGLHFPVLLYLLLWLTVLLGLLMLLHSLSVLCAVLSGNSCPCSLSSVIHFMSLNHCWSSCTHCLWPSVIVVLLFSQLVLAELTTLFHCAPSPVVFCSTHQ